MTAHILAVDDDEAIRSLLRRQFQHWDCDLQVADSGERAIEMLSAEHSLYNLIILDILMPGIDGMEVLEFARDNHPDIPVILLTADLDRARADRALKLGAVDYLQKPVTLGRLQQAIENSIGGLPERPPASDDSVGNQFAQMVRETMQRFLHDGAGAVLTAICSELGTEPDQLSQGHMPQFSNLVEKACADSLKAPQLRFLVGTLRQFQYSRLSSWGPGAG